MLLDLCCLTCVGADYAVDSSSADAVVDYFGAVSVSSYCGSCSSGSACVVVVVFIGLLLGILFGIRMNAGYRHCLPLFGECGSCLVILMKAGYGL